MPPLTVFVGTRLHLPRTPWAGALHSAQGCPDYLVFGRGWWLHHAHGQYGRKRQGRSCPGLLSSASRNVPPGSWRLTWLRKLASGCPGRKILRSLLPLPHSPQKLAAGRHHRCVGLYQLPGGGALLKRCPPGDTEEKPGAAAPGVATPLCARNHDGCGKDGRQGGPDPRDPHCRSCRARRAPAG